MSIYRKQVKNALRNGPRSRQKLARELCPSAMSLRRLQKTFNELLDDDSIFVERIKDSESKKVIAIYGLTKHRYLVDERSGTIQKILAEFEHIYLRNPTVEELAIELGITIEEAQNLAYATAKRTGWRAPTKEIIDSSWEKIGESLFLAARLKTDPVKWEGRFADQPELLAQARYYLRKHPEILPVLNDDASAVVKWSEAALRILGRPYRPHRPVARTRVSR